MWQLLFAECQEESTRQIAFFAECQTDSTRQTIFFIFLFSSSFSSSKYITMHFGNTMSNLLNNIYLIGYFYYFIIYAVIA